MKAIPRAPDRRDREIRDVLDLGVTLGVIEKRGSFYTVGEQRIGQGRENAKRFLQENPGMADEIEGKLRAAMGLPVSQETEG